MTICAINVSDCSVNDAGAGDYCKCVKKPGDHYDILVQQQAKASHSGLLLDAALRSRNIFNPINVIVTIGVLPTVTDIGVLPTVTDQDGVFTLVINNDDKVTILPYQRVFVCS